MHLFTAVSRRRLALPVVALAIVAGCGGGASSPGATPTSAAPSPTPTQTAPVDPTPFPSPSTPAGAQGYWLRMTTSQAIPPVNRFGIAPVVVITADGRLIVPGAVPAIFPGPLVMPLFARQVSDAGREQILAWADELGLLRGKTDFTDGLGIPGGVTGIIELTIDGRRVELTGVPDAQTADTGPGTPAAFAELWRRISDLPSRLPTELGPEQAYAPAAYALLVGPAPQPQDGITGAIADWPLETPLATFGGPVANGTYRCGLVEGADAATLRTALEAANQLTQWTQDPSTSATFGLTVRPIVAGENPCRDTFGS